MSTRRGGGGLVLLACLTLTAAGADAHMPGLSTVEFRQDADGHLDAVFVFAASERIGPLAFSAEQAGLESRRAEIARLVTEDVTVTADGDLCPPTFIGATPSEEDAIRIDARYDCERAAAHLEATLYYLNRMTHGHRQVVRMSAGGREVDRVLGSTSRAIAIDVPTEKPAASWWRRLLRRNVPRVLLVVAVLVAAFFVERLRAHGPL